MEPAFYLLTRSIIFPYEELVMNQNNPETKAQIVYFSHGGGPLPILGDPGHQTMVDFMTRLPQQLTQPDLILVISAHWEEKAATLLGAKNPPMFYDYYGFPEAAYEIQYPAPGSAHNAQRIAELLAQSQIASAVDPERGFDHGLFIPLKMMYPQADIPCLQLSAAARAEPRRPSCRGQSPARITAREHPGDRLRVLLPQHEGVLGNGVPRQNPANDAFQNWLIETCTGAFRRPSASSACWNGKKRRTPATVIRARNICCRCISARRWRKNRLR